MKSNTPIKQRNYLNALVSNKGNVEKAAKEAGINRSTAYRWTSSDPDFQHLKQTVADDLTQEAIRRAKEGSDVLTIFLLKALSPEIYDDRVRLWKMEREAANEDAEKTKEVTITNYGEVLASSDLGRGMLEYALLNRGNWISGTSQTKKGGGA
jgi:hypothetical protein